MFQKQIYMYEYPYPAPLSVPLGMHSLQKVAMYVKCAHTESGLY